MNTHEDLLIERAALSLLALGRRRPMARKARENELLRLKNDPDAQRKSSDQLPPEITREVRETES
jgi:hypothetical protein